MVLPAGAFQGAKPKAKPSQGEALFRKKCASCHGERGKGGPAMSRPLRGTKTVAQLAKFVQTSMPPGKGTPAAEAKKIAAYMHEAFYSPLAQARYKPVRVEMARLTVTQFRNAISDLVDPHWRAAIPLDAPRGIDGEYFKGGDFSEGNRLVKRIDPEIRFDFRDGAPAPEGFDARNYSAAWNGSLLAPDSGEYELILRSDHAVRLWFNGSKQPVVDGWVRADEDREFRATVTLQGGRIYPFYMQFSKHSVGVDDKDKKAKQPVKTAFVELCWRRPKRAPEVIPNRFLIAQGSVPGYVSTVPFPADDRSIGYERGTAISKEWDEATTAAALEAAGHIASRIDEIAGTKSDAPDRVEKVRSWCRQFVERAFRRPIDDAVAQLYINRQFDEAKEVEAAVKRVVVLTVKSPRFLYREIGSPTDPWTVASHLSFGLWDTVPDDELRRAASAGELDTPEGIRKQAERLAAHPRAWTKLRAFYLAWLKVDDNPEIIKSQKRYPDFDDAVASDLRTSLEIFLETNGWGDEAQYEHLMLSPKQPLNSRLAKLYGAQLETEGFQEVTLDNGKRAGVLMHPYVLSRFAYLEGSSPIHRGVLIARNMLGRTLNPPPAAFTPLAAELHPNLTTRERVVLQTKNEPCIGCHRLINPLGFTLEKFDAIGRLRAQDNGKPVNATGAYEATDGEVARFRDGMDLAKYIAESDEAHAAFVEKLFHHLVKQPVRAYGVDLLPALKSNFEKNETRIRPLVVDIVTSTARPTPVSAEAP
jgi:AcrR family transcriptional regulator